MTFSLYDELTSLTNATQTEVKNKLIDLNLAYIFAYVVEKHEEKNWLRPIVQFAAYAYSWESKMVVIGRDWQKTKMQIAQRVNMPPEAYDPVVYLQDEKMADCFAMFLGLYRENMDYVHLVSLKDLYQQVIRNATKFVADEQGNADMNKKIRDIESADDLKEKIDRMEERLTQKYRILNAPKTDFKYDQREHGNPLKIENSKLIRGSH